MDGVQLSICDGLYDGCVLGSSVPEPAEHMTVMMSDGDEMCETHKVNRRDCQGGCL